MKTAMTGDQPLTCDPLPGGQLACPPISSLELRLRLPYRTYKSASLHLVFNRVFSQHWLLVISWDKGPQSELSFLIDPDLRFCPFNKLLIFYIRK